jgi:hypothetical protein
MLFLFGCKGKKNFGYGLSKVLLLVRAAGLVSGHSW